MGTLFTSDQLRSLAFASQLPQRGQIYQTNSYPLSIYILGCIMSSKGSQIEVHDTKGHRSQR